MLDTIQHIDRVTRLLDVIANELDLRAAGHDQSKLISPEKEVFEKYTPLLAGLTYGSEEYHAILLEMKPAIDHHYANNRHHPEHFANGIDGMTLIDLVEMFCDWKAATKRHNNGSLTRSLEINGKRFGMSDQLINIFRNTIKELGW